MKIKRVLCHSFVPELLVDSKTMLDCGANRGEFAFWLSENTKASIHSFEPDPNLYFKLKPLPRVCFHQLAIDGEDGVMDLALGKDHCSSSIYREGGSQEVIQVKKTSLDTFCVKNGITRIDFIKIDIEGAELSLLEKTSDDVLKSIRQITIEFHDFIRASDTPRIKAIERRLNRLGFYSVKLSIFTWGDVLFINTSFFPVSVMDKINMMLFGKYVPGVIRFVKRMLRMG